MSQVNQTISAEEAILSRHSVRKYERDVVIPQAELDEILSLAHSAPSSWNLQHWRFLVIQEQANKDRLLPIAFNQQQVSDASVVVVVLGDLEANLIAPKIYESATPEIRDMMVGQINGAYENNPAVARDEAIRNASLAAMQLMLAARAKGYDTVPMGGYNPQALIQEFKIPARYVPVMLLPIGKAASPARATERLPLDNVVINESF
ncbi:nitroreductase family protein [Paenibacillus mucilaginosus]|uniref:NAD(P)H nitroreductase n=3 Tax=Paenibacillus mucilaginosus TaxID=61624 RepID=I0BAP2_9BACL|nr:nitroreductase family protein [Paenibacillus mucilaginosus]AEI38993.1 putative NAD(P)H nitroreductase [Paenibacillus mucilaginosus KNP414]AFC27295.1 putative NADH nitroreductase [Paenibacillus mucilaginosus 3016]AFH59439.1 NAD(P)H nitroreductase [Paenibacillus mucilaginosus K02]MCG7216129.1 nitroreductase family protein [Paenibacillus mucilaginosus]WDM28034.1 nitroreductase family protein [Paenibacillus mucilaginosus]